MPGHPRKGPVERRQVTLTPDAGGMVEAWAALQGTSFSAALETLARLGLDQAPPDAYAGVLEAAVRGAIRQEMGRVTALVASAAIDAHAGYLVALYVARQRLSPDAYRGLRQASRLMGRDAVRRRVSRQGLDQLLELLSQTAPAELAVAAAAGRNGVDSGAPGGSL
jgi:hypothetical protein